MEKPRFSLDYPLSTGSSQGVPHLLLLGVAGHLCFRCSNSSQPFLSTVRLNLPSHSLCTQSCYSHSKFALGHAVGTLGWSQRSATEFTFGVTNSLLKGQNHFFSTLFTLKLNSVSRHQLELCVRRDVPNSRSE